MLIERHGFAAVAAEADWPDAHRIDCYLRRSGEDASAEQARTGRRRIFGKRADPGMQEDFWERVSDDVEWNV